MPAKIPHQRASCNYFHQHLKGAFTSSTRLSPRATNKPLFCKQNFIHPGPLVIMTETALITKFTSRLSSHSLKRLLLHTSRTSSNKTSRFITNSDWKRYYLVRRLLKSSGVNHFKVSNQPCLGQIWINCMPKLNWSVCFFLFFFFSIILLLTFKWFWFGLTTSWENTEACEKMGSSASNYVWSHSDL